jgi:hypothetical protein
VVLKHPKQPVTKPTETEVKMMTGGSQGDSLRHGITVLQLTALESSDNNCHVVGEIKFYRQTSKKFFFFIIYHN